MRVRVSIHIQDFPLKVNISHTFALSSIECQQPFMAFSQAYQYLERADVPNYEAMHMAVAAEQLTK
jgi:hypothetical protein